MNCKTCGEPAFFAETVESTENVFCSKHAKLDTHFCVVKRNTCMFGEGCSSKLPIYAVKYSTYGAWCGRHKPKGNVIVSRKHKKCKEQNCFKSASYGDKSQWCKNHVPDEEYKKIKGTGMTSTLCKFEGGCTNYARYGKPPSLEKGENSEKFYKSGKVWCAQEYELCKIHSPEYYIPTKVSCCIFETEQGTFCGKQAVVKIDNKQDARCYFCRKHAKTEFKPIKDAKNELPPSFL